MAKFQEVFEDTQALFTNFVAQIDSLREVSIKVLANNTLKEISSVTKASEILKFMTEEDVIVQINEEVFEQLSPEQQLIVVEETIARIYFDMEKSKLKILKPDFTGFSGVIEKHGFTKVNELFITIKAVFAAREEEAAENNE
jgi:hypothetical protein